ncbi:MAG: hypothetical protein RML38_01950 [Bacteroidia bacterium]|nr:hypothetical protein [Bacteroidia bacterium]
MKYKYLQAKTLHKLERNDGFVDSLREACGWWALAQYRAKRSPKYADLVGMSEGKRPQGHAQKINLILKNKLHSF